MDNRQRLRHAVPYVALALFAAELVLVLGSWIYSAAQPVSGVRSLLSGEGLRWLMGRYGRTLASPLLVDIVLWAMTYGVLHRVGFLTARGMDDATAHRPAYRLSQARLLTGLLAVGIVVAVVLLSMVPGAVLLSATGRLWPSPFSAALVPFSAFAVLLLGVWYGTLAGRLRSVADVYAALLDGIRRAAPWLVFYVLVMQAYESLKFVLGF